MNKIIFIQCSVSDPTKDDPYFYDDRTPDGDDFHIDEVIEITNVEELVDQLNSGNNQGNLAKSLSGVEDSLYINPCGTLTDGNIRNLNNKGYVTKTQLNKVAKAEKKFKVGAKGSFISIDQYGYTKTDCIALKKIDPERWAKGQERLFVEVKPDQVLTPTQLEKYKKARTKFLEQEERRKKRERERKQKAEERKKAKALAKAKKLLKDAGVE